TIGIVDELMNIDLIANISVLVFFFFSSRRRHTRFKCDWSSDVCSSDLSQYMGAMIWGISSALHEATEIDQRVARYINDNLADYLMPVNADIQQLEVILVPEEDSFVNPAGVKGIGELGNVGTAAAVANAVYHATGIRVRQLPIRLEKLLTT